MTFSDYIINERGKKFYFTSLGQIARSNNTTLEEWFKDLYYCWTTLQSKTEIKPIKSEVILKKKCSLDKNPQQCFLWKKSQHGCLDCRYYQ